MTAAARRRSQLALAIVVAVAAAALISVTDDVLEDRFLVLSGCWDEGATIGTTTVPTATFWAAWVATKDLGPISHFFYTRGGYTILLYAMCLCALVGWGGSVCLRIVRARTGRVQAPSMEIFAASLVLALLAGGILYLMMVGSQLMAQEAPCLSRGYTYSAMMASLSAGLFTMAFFAWLEKRAPGMWNALDGGDR
jgi:hypothetical protein